MKKNGSLKLICSFLVFFLVFSSFGLCAGADNKGSNNYINDFLIWLKSHRDENRGVPYSHVGDDRFSRWTITYDSAVVALAYIAAEEIGEARKIIDFYIYTPQVWRLGGIIEAFVAGDNIQGEDWSVRTGANLWIGIAGLHLYYKTKDKQYLDFTKKIAEFAIALQCDDNKNPNFGGVALGPDGDPAYSGDQHLSYDSRKPSFRQIYSSEVCIDSYALFSNLYKATAEKKYANAAKNCLKWLKLNALNKTEHRFDRGYQDSVVATDVQSLIISALGVKLLDSFEKGLAENMVDFVEKKCLSTVKYISPLKEEIILQGVDFIDKDRARSLGREPIVTFEWSFQFVNAYRRIESDFERLGQIKKANAYRSKREKLMESLLNAAVKQNPGLAYPYATQDDVVIGHEYNTPKKGNFSAIGVAYAILALKGFDPLAQR
jgi:hypothetical protein